MRLPKFNRFRLKWVIRKAVLPVVLVITLVFGGFFTYDGLSIRHQISQEPSYSLPYFANGAMVGWDPFNGSVNPQVAIGIWPFVNDTPISNLLIEIKGGGAINGVFTLGFISPFIIKREMFTFEGHPNSYLGNWSYENLSSLGSIVYYRQRLTLSQSVILGASVFSFGNLPGRFGQGSYRVFIPFSTYTLSDIFARAMIYPVTFDNGTQNFTFLLYIPWAFLVTGTYPSFTSIQGMGYGPELSQALVYNLNGNGGVSVSYENSTAINQFVALQNEELFSLGVGIPLSLSSALELARLALSSDSSKSRASSQRKRRFSAEGGPGGIQA
jgi:hypothetical protein